MTAETNACNGVLEGSKVEFEGKSGVNLTSCGDLVNAGGECNGIAHEQEAKDETDSSYVFVDGGSDDRGDRDLDVGDPIEDLGSKSIAEGNVEAELNADSLSEQTVVESEELNEKKGENCVDNCCIVGESVVSGGVESEELREDKGEGEIGESSVADHCFVEESGVSFSGDGLQNEPNGDDVEANSIVEGQNKLELVVEVEVKQESQLKVTEGVESKSHPLEKGEEMVMSNTTDDNLVEASTGDLVEPELNPETYSMEGVESESHPLEKEEELETSSVSDEVLVEGSKGDLVELKPETRGCSLGDRKSETEVVDGPVEYPESHTEVEVKNVSDESGKVETGNESSVVSGELEIEVKNVSDESGKVEIGNESVEGEESILTCPVDVLNPEAEITNVSAEAVEVMPPCSVDNLGLESQIRHGTPESSGSISVCFVDDTEVVSEVRSVSIGNGTDFPISLSDGMISEGEVENVSARSDENLPAHEADDLKSVAVVENGSCRSDENLPPSQADEVKSEEVENGAARSDESLPAHQVDDLKSGEVEYGSTRSGESLPARQVDDEKSKEVENGSARSGESMHDHQVDDLKSGEEVENGSARGGESSPAHQIDDSKSEIEHRNGFVETGESLLAGPLDEESKNEDKNNGNVESGETSNVDNSILKPEATNGYVETSEILITCPADDLKLEAKVTNGQRECHESLPTCPIDEESETKVREDESCEPTCPIDEESETIVREDESCEPTCPIDEESETVVRKDESCEPTCPIDEESEAIVKKDESSESVPECATNVVDVYNEDQSTNKDDDDNKSTCKEAEGVEGIPLDGVLQCSQQDSNAVALDGMKMDAELGKKLPNFIIRIPRYADNKFKAQIKIAELQVDEKTQHRDSIRMAMQLKKATCTEYREKFEAAKLEERAARDAVFAKRQEIDSIQSVINRMKNATSIEEIGERIHNMEHMIEHETMPLKDEKQLIREIKQLKHAREQLCVNTGTQAEIQEAFDQKDSIEKRFKLLKQEVDSLRNEVSRTEGITRAAKKKHYDEYEKLRELQAQFKAADDLRQDSYAYLQKLKKQMYEKNKYFRVYKDDDRAAADYASRGEREALQRHCTNQVEKIMELWNNNDEFRNDYVKHNMMSTLRRFKTLDGRSLGPDEEPPVLRNLMEEGTDASHLASAKISTSSVVSAPEMKQEKPGVPVAPEIAKSEMGQKNLPAKTKKTTKPTSSETGPVMVSSGVEIVEETEKESKRTKEEEEMTRKAEELARKEEAVRTEEAAAKLKEQRRLEEKAKAKEAEERKRRNAEKAQARAELRAQKEADLKEKEREKRLKKKERKKAAASGTMSGGIEVVPAESSDNIQPESTQEPEIKDKPAAVTKKASKSLPAVKQTKTKPVPLPLRNRGKRKMQSWMWIVFIAVLLLALFLVGNNISSFKFSRHSFGF